MKRYIRTKDGRIYDTEVNGAWEQTNGIIGIPTFGCIVKIPQDFITKQADTIEKLCDRYVLHHTDIIFLNKEHTKYRFENEPNNWYDITDTEIRVGIYGAIWTDKGLIYKAKMNEKGELELL